MFLVDESNKVVDKCLDLVLDLIRILIASNGCMLRFELRVPVRVSNSISVVSIASLFSQRFIECLDFLLGCFACRSDSSFYDTALCA